MFTDLSSFGQDRFTVIDVVERDAILGGNIEAVHEHLSSKLECEVHFVNGGRAIAVKMTQDPISFFGNCDSLDAQRPRIDSIEKAMRLDYQRMVKALIGIPVRGYYVEAVLSGNEFTVSTLQITHQTVIDWSKIRITIIPNRKTAHNRSAIESVVREWLDISSKSGIGGGPNFSFNY